jgi:hypothetical protein
VTKLRDSELAVLGIEKRAGVRFDTDMLDVHPQRYEIVALLPDGVIVKRITWSQRPPPGAGKEEVDDDASG